MVAVEKQRQVAAVPKRFARNFPAGVICFAKLLECVRVVASLSTRGQTHHGVRLWHVRERLSVFLANFFPRD